MGLSKKPYKGTRDFFPKDKRVLNFLMDAMHSQPANSDTKITMASFRGG